MTSRIMTPVLKGNTFDPRGPVLDTLAEIDQQLDLLRKRKVGATAVESGAVESLFFLVKRARGQVRRIPEAVR
jgi:hypothetical protein